MKKVLKEFRPALLVVLLIFICCQQDDLYIDNPNASSKGNSRMITYGELKAMPKAITMLETIKKKKRQKSVYNEYYNFTIDTTAIALFEIGDYHSLTFTITRDNTEEGIVENLILNWEPYEDYKCFLTKYTLSEDDIEKIELNNPVDLSGKESLTHLTEFNSRSVLKSSGGNQPNLVKIDGDCFIVTYVRRTSYSNIPGQLEYSVWEEVLEPVPCPEENSDYSYTLDPNAGGFYIPIMNIPYPQPYIPVPGLSGGGSPESGGNNSSFNPVITKPRVLVAILKECKKIKNALDNNNFRQEVVNLAGTVNDPVNENGVGMDFYGNVISFPPGPEIEVPVPLGASIFPNAYMVVSHTHNAGKLSVFSFADFEAIAKLLSKDKIKVGTFVATLSTQKGTHYAITISDLTKFKDFFYHKFHDIANLPLADKNT